MILGSDGAGTIAAVGSGVRGFKVGDEVLGLKAGDTLIIHGAAGAVGTLAVQFARLRGVRVLATASNDQDLVPRRRLGADAVVNGRSGDIAAAEAAKLQLPIAAQFPLADAAAAHRRLEAGHLSGKILLRVRSS